jgi:hypothetical protein
MIVESQCAIDFVSSLKSPQRFWIAEATTLEAEYASEICV